MDNNIFDKIPDFDEIVSAKSYRELTKTEKELISEFYSEEDYDNLHQTIIFAKSEFKKEQIVVSEKTADSLEKAFINKSNRKPFALILKISKFRLPAYQSAAMFLLLFLFYFIMRTPSNQEVKYITKTDTLYVEKIVTQNVIQAPKTMTVSGNHKLSSKNINTSLNIREEDTTNDNEIERQSVPVGAFFRNEFSKTQNNIKLLKETRKGASIKNDSNLWVFLQIAI